MQRWLEGLKSVGLCVAAALIYGILHNSVIVALCPEYYTRHIRALIPADSPWLLGLAWALAAALPFGAFLGLVIGVLANAGKLPPLKCGALLLPIANLMASVALVTALVGSWAYRSPDSFINPLAMVLIQGYGLPPESLRNDGPYMSAHIATWVSLNAAIWGAAILAVWISHRRDDFARLSWLRRLLWKG